MLPFFPWATSTKPQDPPPEDKVADIETATIYLETLSRRAIYYSVQHGGNGKTNFPLNIGDIYSVIPTKLKSAIIADTIDNPIPIDGYLFKMQDSLDGKSFYFEAIPAEGFQGKVIGITPKVLLKEMSNEGLIVVRGNGNGARWYPK